MGYTYRRRRSGPNWGLIASLVLVPLAFAAHLAHAPEMVVFALSAASLVPIAGLIGEATEGLAEHYGGSLGGRIGPGVVLNAFTPMMIWESS